MTHDNKIADLIGMPALLEQTAEECAELAQACLKYARKLRGENPTPKTFCDCLENLREELGDVQGCINHIKDAGLGPDPETMASKTDRWYKRIEDAGREVDV